MVVSKMNKDAQMRAAINQKLIETGERERLKELLRAKLIECGWKDQLKVCVVNHTILALHFQNDWSSLCGSDSKPGKVRAVLSLRGGVPATVF
uniref:ENY2 transcription and export complex 2 subunit n=1 Tax=Oryctolagus cuniculus TaxID=9986 RepID=G1SMB1_RABIT